VIPFVIPFSGYCDAGTIGHNPTKLGITWAWTWVDQTGKRIKWESGIIEPDDTGMEILTNNFAELFSALRLIDSLPVDWKGTIFTDNIHVQRRLTYSNSFKGIPLWMQNWCKTVRKHRGYEIGLLAGHPSKADLARGHKSKSKLPVSEHNHFCDRECTRLAKEFQLRLKGT
jgi:hypothetical protein